MSEDDPASPRARISKWLLKANDNTDRSGRGVPTKPTRSRSEKRDRTPQPSTQLARLSKVPPLTKDLTNDTRNHTSAAYQNYSPRQVRRKPTGTVQRPDAGNAEAPSESPGPQAHNIAKRLGLQGPFRSFGNEEGPDLFGKSRSAKRQRKAVTSSSDLQPAVSVDITMNGHKKSTSHTIMANGDSPKSSHDLDGSMLFSPPKKAQVNYERRPRHKTREDHYEVRPTKDRKRKVPNHATDKTKPAGRRKTRLKSGGVLMHDFNAPNVSNDRLTLRPGRPSGIFGHGKASSPVKRRGLPDLAFSELAFLNTKRHEIKDQNHKQVKEDGKKAKKATRTLDTEADISNYFMAHKTQRHVDEKGSGIYRHVEKTRRSLSTDSARIVDLPNTPFLGFGTNGANSVSPVKIVKELDARYLPTLSKRDTRSPSRASSYLSWEPSNAPLPISKSSEKPGRQPSSHGVQKPNSENIRISREEGILDGPLVYKAHSVQASALRKVDDAAENIAACQDDDNTTERNKVVDRYNLHVAVEGEGLPENKRMDTGEASQSGIARAEALSKLIAEVTGTHKAGALLGTQQVDVAAVSADQASISQKQYESLESTLQTLLYACKARLSGTPEKDYKTVPQNHDDGRSMKAAMKSDLVAEVENAAATIRAAPDRAAPSGPRINGAPLTTLDVQPSTNSFELPYGSNPKAPTNGARQYRTDNFVMENHCIEPNGFHYSPRSTDDPSRNFGNANRESAAPDRVYSHLDHSLKWEDDLVAAEVSSVEFDIAKDDEQKLFQGHYQSVYNESHESQDGRLFSLPFEEHSQLNILDRHPVLQNAFFQTPRPQTIDSITHEYLCDPERPQTGRSFPLSNKYLVNTQRRNVNCQERGRRGGEEAAIRLEGFWKPNKLY